MKVQFEKYCASGNDFVIFNYSDLGRLLAEEEIREICHRQFGIGADGVLLCQNHSSLDFKMRIFNADGGEADMCANGARALIHYAHYHLKKPKSEFQFETNKAQYEGKVEGNFISLKMTDIYDQNKIHYPKLFNKQFYVNTGVPHMVFEVDDLQKLDVCAIGAKVRYDKLFEKGTNVDFFKVIAPHEVDFRVYERGVEGETLSCGTGVVATALACHEFYGWSGEIKFQTKGGVVFAEISQDLKNIYYKGEVKNTFSGAYFL
jgi:diaminopimelate epimerase